jgi:hypothetical protein
MLTLKVSEHAMNVDKLRCVSGLEELRGHYESKKNREFLLPVSTRFLKKEVVKTARLSGYPE